LLDGWAVAETADGRERKPLGVVAAIEVGDVGVYEGADGGP